MKKLFYVISAVALLASVSCSDQGSNKSEAEESFKMDNNDQVAVTTQIDLTAGDDMQFNQKKFNIPAGQKVTLTLTHTGTMAKEMMGHNVVILTQGSSTKEYGNEAMAAKDEEYVPKALASQVVAATKLIGGGESTKIEFSIDIPGEYPFLCSFPGHYPIMYGSIIVQ